MKVVLDVFGGDKPVEIVKGAIKSVQEIKDLTVVLAGDKSKIDEFFVEAKQEKEYLKFDENRIEILDAKEVISCDDKPTDAIRTKKESSLVKGLDLLKANEEVIAFISAGSTGAVLTGGFMKIGRMKGVSRPALCPALPTMGDRPVCLIDCGANMDCKPLNLLHFAIIGSTYYKFMFKTEKPRVAILNVGTEDEKGNDLVKKTLPYMKDLDINFVGSMEARDFLSGDYDVVVTDGFAGNTLLKGCEGAASILVSALKQTIKNSGFKTKIGGLLIKKSLKRMIKRFDYSCYGGSPFLGINKMVFKVHGNSKALSVYECVKQAVSLSKSDCYKNIQEAILKQEITLPDNY
ncbi:MAG: phosphate acyltransferase PlsX [Clostridiales bacterium]|nr:phosphate acyltransferase PlsX [Candidatus Apopatousia equi]